VNISLGCFCILLTTQCDPHSAKAFQVDETSVIFTTILSEQIFKHFLEKKIRKACLIQLSQLDFGMTDHCLKVLSSLLLPQAKIGKEWIEILQSLGFKKFDSAETVNDYKTAYKSQVVVKYSNNFLSVVFSPSCEEFAELNMKEIDVI